MSGGTGTKQSYPALAFAFALLTSACIVWVLDDSPLIGMATNADMLLPSAWAQTIFHDDYGWRTFQLPRTSSIFPDLIVHTFLQIATGSWRTASLLYGWLQLAAIVTAAALIIRQITGTSRVLGASVFALLVAVLFTLEALVGLDGATSRGRLIVEIAAHGGAFLLTLFAATLIFRMATEKTGRAAPALLFALSATAYFSDQLTVFEVHLPAVVAIAALRRKLSWSTVFMIVVPLALGAIVAEPLLKLVNHQFIAPSSGRPWRVIRDVTPMVFATWYVPAFVVLALPSLNDRFGNWISSRTGDLSRQFYWSFGGSAVVLTLAAAAILIYRDNGGYRYFYALAWWPIILGASLVAAIFSQYRLGALAAAVFSLALLLPQVALRPPALLTWTSPVADCLAKHRAGYRLDAGLATYWQARPIEASSDWTIKMEATTENASFYYWGNDRQRYLDMLGRFNFLVMDNLDPHLITRRFGSPEKKLQCPGTEVWVYPHGYMAAKLDH